MCQRDHRTGHEGTKQMGFLINKSVVQSDDSLQRLSNYTGFRFTQEEGFFRKLEHSVYHQNPSG